jgi:hypothetical protein
MANHISHAALPYPVKNARYTLLVPFLDADGDPTDPTTPDTEVSQDNGAFADAAEEVTTASGSNGVGMVTLTGAETNNSTVGVAFKVASGPKATLATIYPRVLATVGSGTLSAGSAGGGTLGTLLAYDVTGCFVRTTGGTGGGGTGGANNQARKVVTYNTSTGAFTVSPNWETTPSTDTTYDVLLPEGVTLGMLRTLNPTTPGNTADVAATGEIGLDFSNIKDAGSAHTLTNIRVPNVTLVDTITTYTGNTVQTGDSFARIGLTGSGLTSLATAAQVAGLQVNTRANLNVPVEIETPDSSTQVYKVRLHLFDVEGNMEAPDSTPTVTLTNAAGTDRSSRLSAASNPSTGVYTWDYTATAGDAEEQLVWVFTVVEGGLTRTYPATSYVVEESAYRFSSTDRANLGAILTRLPAALTASGNIRADVEEFAATGPMIVSGNPGTRFGQLFGDASLRPDEIVAASTRDVLNTAPAANSLGAAVKKVADRAGTTGTLAVAGDAMTLSSAYDFAKGTTAVTESYAANGVAPTPVQALMAIHQMLMQFAISGTAYSVKKLDNTTLAFTVTLDDASAPTSAVRV